MRRWRRAVWAGALAAALSVAPIATASTRSIEPPARASDPLLPLGLRPTVVPSNWPAVYHVATSDPVVFVTLDDGWTRSPSAYADIRARGWPVTNFVTSEALAADPSWFETIGNPTTFGDHTITHTDLTTLSYSAQVHEICGGRDAVESLTGAKPGWFRAPYGSWNATTISAANACGYPGTVLWDVTVDGTNVATTYGTIRAGDIILLHYTPTLTTGIDTLAGLLANLGLHPAPLASYLPPAFAQPTGLVTAQWFLRNTSTSGVADETLVYGDRGDIPLTGDWNGDGTDTIGVQRGPFFLLRNSNTNGVADIGFQYGDDGDAAVVGDWNGDGTDTIGIVRGNVWYLRNSNTSGTADLVVTYGDPGDRHVVGDWNRDGTDTIAIVRGGTWYVRNSNTSGVADNVFLYGDARDLHLVGHWVPSAPSDGPGSAR